MGMRKWLGWWTVGLERVRNHLSGPRLPVVEFDNITVTCRRSGGLVETIRWDDLTAVLIMTTSAGPFADDVFWVLVGNSSGCVVPSEAEGSRELIERLQKLPGFDHEAVIQAMGCTDDRKLLCWKRAD